MTVIYKNNTYRFIGYSDLSGTEVTAERGGRFYRLPVSQCQLIKNVSHTSSDDKNVTAQ